MNAYAQDMIVREGQPSRDRFESSAEQHREQQDRRRAKGRRAGAPPGAATSACVNSTAGSSRAHTLSCEPYNCVSETVVAVAGAGSPSQTGALQAAIPVLLGSSEAAGAKPFSKPNSPHPLSEKYRLAVDGDPASGDSFLCQAECERPCVADDGERPMLRRGLHRPRGLPCETHFSIVSVGPLVSPARGQEGEPT